MSIILLVRGLPGSGKSTHALKVIGEHPDFVHLETDKFFMKDGIYKFDTSKLGQTHAWCQTLAAAHMIAGNSIIVSNTFSRRWEMTVYDLLAKAYDYQVYETDLFDAGLTDVELALRCVHRVPVDQIARMRARWEK